MKSRHCHVFLPFLLGFFFAAWMTVFSHANAWASVTLEDEVKVGREFYEKLEKSHALVEDDTANAYISSLGKRILSHSGHPLFEFKFSIIQSSAVNAFATPGGYVYVNQGLISLVDEESQLAGVMAHEIAHVNCRHIADIVDKSQKLTIPTLAAILAGAFLGGDAGAAVASFSVATVTSMSLKYSREHEEEADRVGMGYLVASGYNGQAMMDFLKIMKRYEFYSNSVPSYFLTHPGTDERIRYIDALLHTTYTKKGADDIVGNLKRIQTTLMLDGKTDPAQNLKHFEKLLVDDPKDVDALYGLAVTQDKLGQSRESLDTYQKALRIAPNDVDILRNCGITLFNMGQYGDAAAYLGRAMKLNDRHPDAYLYLGKSLESLGNLPDAIRYYKELVQKKPESPEVYYNLAMAYGKSRQSGDSHYYFGLYFKKKGKTDSALFHFKEAQKYLSGDTARLKEIEKEIDSLGRGEAPKAPSAGKGRGRGDKTP
ncbi:MAG: M48 family metalloprotease [Deltaproteobacteria bacterium]|nr:M48 family metalloprotease [Deltaproteobacteria bacterium]